MRALNTNLYDPLLGLLACMFLQSATSLPNPANLTFIMQRVANSVLAMVSCTNMATDVSTCEQAQECDGASGPDHEHGHCAVLMAACRRDMHAKLLAATAVPAAAPRMRVSPRPVLLAGLQSLLSDEA